MPRKDVNDRGKGDPPTPSSPMWLPSLGQTTAGALRHKQTLSKTRTLPSAGSTLKTGVELLSPKTLPSLEAFEIPGRKRQKGTHSAVPKLPAISGGSASLIHSRAAHDVSRRQDGGQEQATTDIMEASDSSDDEEDAAAMDEDVAGDGLPAEDLTYDPDMMPGVDTSNDIIEFYGKFGKESPVKFFYCNRAKEGLRLRPYDLVVVKRQKVDAEYFTVSATGVMRIRKGVQAEFTPLAEWVREKTLFDLLSSISFFKNYLIGKCFRKWHQGVRRTNFNRIKQRIEDSLFLAKPTFCGHLRELAAYVSEIQQIQFVWANPNHLYQLQEFTDLQVQTREQKAKPALEAIVEKMQKVLENVCCEVQKQARLYQESIRDVSELEDTTGVELLQGRTAGKARSMVAIKKEKIDRSKNFARVMQEVTMLRSFIRLADYLFIEGVIARVVVTAEDLLTLLQAQRQQADKQSKGVFLTTLSFVPDGSKFAPDAQAVLDELNGIIEGVVNIAQQAPRLLFMRAFNQYFDGKPGGLNAMSVIRGTPWFWDLRTQINETVSGDFGAAREYVKLFEDYRKVYHFGRTWNADAYSLEPKTLRSIRLDMKEQRDWRNELEKMKISNIVGCLYVDSKSLRNDLIPITTNTLDRIKLLLLAMARDSCLACLEDTKARTALLQARPTQLDEFMSYQGMQKQQLDEKKIVLLEANNVDEMYETLAIYEQKVPTADQVKHDDLREALQLFLQELVAGRHYLTDQKEFQINTLQDNMRNINIELLEMHTKLHGGMYVDPEADPATVVADLEAQLAHWAELQASCATCNQYQVLFELEPEDIGSLLLVEKELNSRYQLWKSLLDFLDKSNAWTDGAVLDDSNATRLSIEAIKQEVDDYTTRAYKMSKALKEDPVVARLRDCIDDFKEIMPCVEELINPALKLRHWDEIFDLIGADITDNDEGTGYVPFSINMLLGFNVLDNLERIAATSTNASKEYSLEKAMEKMKNDWVGMEFRVIEYKDTGTYIVGGTDEVQAILDDQIVKVQSMRASPYIKPLEKETMEWEALLVRLQDILDNWLTCQATWQYLEPIFSSPDILKQMPEEGEKFQQVDQSWREIMDAVQNNASCLVVGQDKDKLVALEDSNRLLEEIQKGLAAYLEVKRIAFPRFFFLSNDEMLEILSETKDPTRVQPHLKKCFEGIDKLRFEQNADITGMISVEGELIPLKTRIKPMETGGAVEKWLVQVERGMVESMHERCMEGMLSYPAASREQWVLEWPGQVVLVVTGMFWTMDVSNAIASGFKGALREVSNRCSSQLGNIVNLVRGELSKLNRATLSALVVMDVHARDVVEQLATEEIEGQTTHFSWLSQLRMYAEDSHEDPSTKTIMVRMMNAHVEYGYEYLGNSSRLVVTPLTDRCYRTLIGAIHLNLGGAPEGPAGTGKTETTKDLAKALARQCVVFNCSDTLDYITMAKFFKGLAAAGCWACFDEFNRIDLEVLSVVAQQVLEIQLAVKSRVKTFFFEGSELPLRPTCNAFITMNPGYAGRSELPDNLKALFRTVAMMVPDYALISEIMLYSNGYLKARECARKIVATYKLCSEQLSSQDHYDYGMRAVMAVLRAAGNMKRKYPNEDEYILMLRSIIDVNLCKFLSHDVPLFEGIVSDLFPGVVLPTPDYDSLTTAMKKQCALLNLQPTEYFLMKTTQLYEMIVVRHGLMTVGQPFSGKSASLRVLAGALTDLAEQGVPGVLFNRVQMRMINPKSVTMGQLYGETDRATQEWKDGVLAVTFRSLASDPSEDRKWVVLDGPVDAIWIENMNTVLDDNKKLCLPNSEIIQMSATMSMIFEVGDLAAASPATVSRCGMVYLEPHQLGWRPLLLSWLQTLPKALGPRMKKQIEGLFDWMMPACLRFTRKEVKEISPTEESNLASSAMRLMLSLLDEFQQGSDEATPCLGSAMDETSKLLLVESTFLFALVWSCGCTGDAESRKKFDAFFRTLAAGGVPSGYSDFVPQKHVTIMAPMMPDDSQVFDYMFNKQALKWTLWTDTIAPLSIPEGAQFSDIIVPTKDMQRYTFLLDVALQHGYPLLMVGPTGTGKSVYMGRHLVSLPKESWAPIFITFSARTTANMTQEQVDGRLDKRKKGVYGPSIGRKAVVFVDDLNMPSKEVYGAQPPIELLRQFMDYAGWYGRDNVFRSMVDVQFVAAMGPPGGGRTFVSNRYQRHFHCLALSQVEDANLVHIFRTVLDWHISAGAFPTQIKACVPAVIDATLEMYTAAAAKLLPTPTKSHYVFNLRDFARVVQGMMMLPKASLPEDAAQAGAMYKRLWVHEVLRVFYDRLVDDKDRQWLLKQVKATVKGVLKEDFNTLMAGILESAEAEIVTSEDMRRCFFGDYLDTDAEPADRKYAEVTNIPKLLSSMEDYLTDFNGLSKRPMNLAMFLFAVEHVSRICRLLKQPGGHMLLVGVGGSGRASLTRLAAFICGMDVFQVEITKSYGRTEWREDLQRFLKQAGGDGKATVFLFSDTQIKDEAFVEDVNNILNSGEVPNMFPSDVKAQILEQVRPSASKLGLESPVELWAHFVERCRKNLHIVLCMSPIGNQFRERLRQNPSIANCCTIDWFQKWPTDALEAVAMKFLKEMDLETKTRIKLVKLCQAFHSRVQEESEAFLADLGRHNYVTPTSYLELISTFQKLLDEKRAHNTKLKTRYLVGLQKLQNSAEQVAGMQVELKALQPQLVKTVAEVEQLMIDIAREKTQVVEPKAAIVKRDEAVAQEKADAAKAIKDECEGELAVAMPILNEALAALDTIKEADINYIKKLGNPPAAIKLVMEVICVILDVKPAKAKDDTGKAIQDYWKPSVALLNEKDFLQKLKTYDKDNIPARIIQVIRASYLTNDQFTPDNAKKASPAAEGMCKWVHAMSSYDKVAKVVAPKKAALAVAESGYQEVLVGLRAKQAELQILLDKLAAMEADLALNTNKKSRLEAEVELCTVKLDRASKLIGGLGGEKARWTDTASALTAAFTNLTGDMLVCAGVISYLGAFTAAYRQRITHEFVQLCVEEHIPHSPKFATTTVLGDPVKVREWLIAGLPNDAFSIENAIVVATARRWPLMIDPQGQANKWIKNLEKTRNLQVIKISEGGEYLRVLENAIQFGQPVLLENVGEELDPSLEPLLLRQVFKQGGVDCIRMGDNAIEYSSDFSFYMTTKLRNPHYLPEVAVKVTLLNFMITPAGLADQMLGVVVATERPDLEEQKAALVLQSADNKRKLKEIEDKILEVLSSSTGNILEDETAISVITAAKELGNDILEKQRAAAATEAQIDEARVGYQPCGDYTSILFFAISDLASVDPMYQYSLPWFVSLFVASVRAAEPADNLPQRLKNIHDHFTYALYCNVCRSLFEKDKLLFAFLLASRILESKGKVDPDDWTFLLTGGLGSTTEPNPAPEWLVDRAWKELCKLSRLMSFAGLSDSVSADAESWRPLHSSSEPHKVVLPCHYNQLDSFKKLLVVRCVRPDKVVPAVADFVLQHLGRSFVEPPPFSLTDCYRDSSSLTPLIFVLSPGSDPTAALLQFAGERGMGSRLSAISLGQGQGGKAEALIQECAKSGGWVLLQNCHLAPSWMPSLDKICEELTADTVSPDFRIWMTSYPSPKFPVNILQNGVKMTNEPPKGIRANMKRSYMLEPVCTDEFFETCSKPESFKKLLFGLVFFHAVIQERRKFGALGWNIPYGFDDGDLRISVRQLHMFLNENDATPFQALRYVTGECNYGGRVTDDKDRLLLNTILTNCYNPGLIQPDNSYKLSSSGLYYAPAPGPRDSYLTYINGLPISPQPEAFGLHENADISKDQTDTSLMLSSLLLMGGGGGGGGSGGAGHEERVAVVVQECLRRLPANFDIEAVQAKYPVQYEESMNTVLTQEMSRFNRLLTVIRDSLAAIDLAIQGLVVMSSELESAFRSIAINQVPALWHKASYPSLKPLASYLDDLYQRLGMLQGWYEGMAPPAFWLPGFFFVQSFLTASLQNYARRHKVAIDMVGYDYEMMGMDPEALIAPPAEGVYIHGMFLEGCGWDPARKLLCESQPKVLFVSAPVMWLRPTPLDRVQAFPHYNCPLYRTAERKGQLATTGHSTNFVMFAKLPTDRDPQHWIMRGVALLSQLSD